MAATSATAAPASVAPLDLASPATPANDSEQARQAEAAELARRLVAGVTLPAGAVKVTAPPAPDLSAAPQTEETQRMATASALFTVPNSVDSATVFAFVEQHLAAGFTNSGGGSGDGPEDVVFEGVPTDAFEAPQLMVTTEQAGNLMGVRVDAEVVWLPVRTAAETVPTSVTGAELAYAGGAAPTTIAVGPTDARRLASIVNALPTLSDAKHHCPAHTSGITLTFDTKPSTVVEVGICGSEAGVAVGGVDQPSLADSGSLEGAVDALLGLPVNSPVN